MQANFRAMGCAVAVLRDGGRADALDTLPEWFEAREDVLSRFRTRSALSRLNGQPGVAVAVESTLWHALDVALRAAEWTGGLVTPTVGDAMLAAGYDRDFDAMTGTTGARVIPLRPVAAARAPDWRTIERDHLERTVKLPPGVRLDLGGTVKGSVADELARKLGDAAPVLIDVGGDIAVRGVRHSGEPWPVGVANPKRPSEPLYVLGLSKGGVATSGRDHRRWDGGHHLIDPRTGRPAETRVLTATVVADAALTAEVAAKMVVLLGPDEGLAWVEARGLAAVAVLDDGAVRESRHFEDFVWK